MSTKQIGWALVQKCKRPLDKLVLCVLANRSDKEGWSFMSQATIAKLACSNRQSVNEALARLGKSGLIARVARFTPSGARTTDHIRISEGLPCRDFVQAPVGIQDTIPSTSYEVRKTGGSAPTLRIVK